MINMRDKRFVAEHRGGLLTKQNHSLLMHWAIECSEHVLHLVDTNIDVRLLNALSVAREWENGNVKTGQAMKASLAAHAAAREITDPVYISIARAIGQTVATAHMADHSMGGAIYGLKAIKLKGESIEKEREWQNQRLQILLPDDVVKLVLETRVVKEKGFKDLRD
jgi:hypothetical protein